VAFLARHNLQVGMCAAAFSPGCAANAWPRNTGRRRGLVDYAVKR